MKNLEVQTSPARRKQTLVMLRLPMGMKVGSEEPEVVWREDSVLESRSQGTKVLVPAQGLWAPVIAKSQDTLCWPPPSFHSCSVP